MSGNRENILSNALITGANGMVGSYIDFGVKLDHRALDVTDLNETIKTVEKYMPKVIIHLAAETDFDRCERDMSYAFAVNAIGTYNVAYAARTVGAKMVYVSTSAVFDGEKKDPYTESDKPNPRNYYGHSKYLGELAVAGMSEDYLILRICWVFGGGPEKDQKFVAKIIKQLQQPVINIISGKRGSPTYGKDLVAGIKRLTEEGKTGIYHMGNEGTPTRMDIAKEIIKLCKANVEVREVDSSFFSVQYSDRLDNESMTSRVHYMRPWQEALKEYIETEWKGNI